MDLLLIDPPRIYWGFGGGMGYYSPPVGLAVLAGFLEQQGVNVDILDCNALEISWDALAEEIRKRAPRCVGVSSSMTCYVPDAFRCLELVKQVDPTIHTIGGGLQFTLAPEECFRRCESLDIIVRGDGEHTTLALLEELSRGGTKLERVEGLSFRRDGRILGNPERAPVADLDALPFPAWHMLPMDAYRLPVVPRSWGNYAIVVTTRGCPFRCRFCSPQTGQAPYRAMGAPRSDLSFNVNSARTEAILDGIVARGWKVRVALDGTRTDLIVRDRHLLPKMKRAGVFLVCMGVESHFEKDLAYYRKDTNLRQARQAVDLVKKHGIHAWCFFMIGHSEHGEQDILDMFEYAKALDPTIAIFAVVTPIPGTQFYDEMMEQGLIVDFDWKRYDLAHPVMETPQLSGERIIDLIDYCYEHFYKRPRKIIKHAIFGDDFARYTYRFMRFVGAARLIKQGKV